MAVIQVRCSDELKQKATELYEKLGLSLSSAIRMFLARSVGVQGAPFPMMIDSYEPKPADPETFEILRRIQEKSKEKGLDKMTLEEINEEIRLAREERKNKN